MFYQLPNGKVIELSTEQYIEMSDEELEYLIAYNYGDIYENPWHGSILTKHDRIHDEDLSDITLPLNEIPEIDKLTDLDADLEIDE
jgi:hypothetical protein